jgi:NifU-like protein involved in Fe-S cluster formation
MSDDLYHRALMELAHAAAGAGRLPEADGTATADNPLCGDRVTLEIRLKDGRIAALAHQVRGCVLCRAAASLIGARAVGLTAAEATAAGMALAEVLAGRPAPVDAWPELAAFAPVAAYRSRHRCAALPFEALEKALVASLTFR